MSELGVRPKLRFWAKLIMKQTQKSDFKKFRFWAHKPFKNSKKTFQPFESLNSDVRARRKAQITILGQKEHETDAKIRTSRNSASKLTNPLEMVKKTFQAFELVNSDVRSRS